MNPQNISVLVRLLGVPNTSGIWRIVGCLGLVNMGKLRDMAGVECGGGWFSTLHVVDYFIL